MGQDVWYVLDTRVLERSEASAHSTSTFVVPIIIYDKLFQYEV